METEEIKNELKNFISPSRWKLVFSILLVLLSVSSVLIFQANKPEAEENLEKGLELRKYAVSDQVLLNRFHETNQTGKFERTRQILENKSGYNGTQAVSKYGNDYAVSLDENPEVILAGHVGVLANFIDSGYPYPCYFGPNPNRYLKGGCSLYVDEVKVDRYLNPETSRLVLKFAEENNLSLSNSYRQKINRTDFGTPLYLYNSQFVQELEGAEPVRIHQLVIHLLYIFVLGYLVSSLFIYLKDELFARLGDLI